jgi:hypothetical protein
MDKLTNEQENSATRSVLADWVGSTVATTPLPHEELRSGENKNVPDTNPITDRLVDLIGELNGTGVNYISIGPSTSTSYLFNPVAVLINSGIAPLTELYHGYAWDSIEVTASLSDMKGVAGAVGVGYYPYVPWVSGVSGKAIETNYRFDTNMLTQSTVNTSPESHFMTFGAEQDVKFTIPWQYCVPYIPYSSLYAASQWQSGATSLSSRIDYGTPLIWLWKNYAAYVGSVAQPGRFRLFVKFNNLRLTAPTPNNGIDFRRSKLENMISQSGLEAAAAAVAIETAVTAGTEILQSLVATATEDDLPDYSKDGSYEKPMAVQQAFLGDVAIIGPPSTSPLFSKPLNYLSGDHSIKEMLSRAQWLTNQSINGTTQVYLGNPNFPRGYAQGSEQDVTYMKWFGQAAQFWKGTILYHFLVLGHPMVEFSYDLQIGYPEFGPPSTLKDGTTTYSPTLTGVGNGVMHIVVPMPTALVVDHIPVIDNIGSGSESVLQNCVFNCSTSYVKVKFDVVSTMLDAAPALQVAVFQSAGDDFEFLQPAAVGLAHVGDAPDFLRERRKAINEMESQVRLPAVTTMFETRAQTQGDTNTMPAFKNVEDYFKIWSRAIPYDVVDSNDEPQPDYKVGCAPCWWNFTEPDSAAITPDVNNSWYMTNDYLSLFSSQYLYYRGSIAHKIVCTATEGDQYKWVSLGLAAPLLRQQCHTPFTYSADAIPYDANFGYGVAITPANRQPVVEVTIPMRTPLTWRPVFWDYRTNKTIPAGSFNLCSTPNVDHNIVLWDPETGDLKDALFRKGGEDYSVAVEGCLPSPYLWIARGFDWSFDASAVASGKHTVKTPSGVQPRATGVPVGTGIPIRRARK